jgi:Flp pilus assembly protein TadD
MLRRNIKPTMPLGQVSAEDLNELITNFNKAIESDPEDAQAYYGRGIAYMMKGRYQRRRDYLGQGDIDKAIADFTRVIRLGVTDPDVYMRRGATYQANGELDKAIADFTEAIRIAPTEPKAYSARANAYERKKQRDKASADRSKAKELTPPAE